MGVGTSIALGAAAAASAAGSVASAQAKKKGAQKAEGTQREAMARNIALQSKIFEQGGEARSASQRAILRLEQLVQGDLSGATSRRADELTNEVNGQLSSTGNLRSGNAAGLTLDAVARANADERAERLGGNQVIGQLAGQIGGASSGQAASLAAPIQAGADNISDLQLAQGAADGAAISAAANAPLQIATAASLGMGQKDKPKGGPLDFPSGKSGDVDPLTLDGLLGGGSGSSGTGSGLSMAPGSGSAGSGLSMAPGSGSAGSGLGMTMEDRTPGFDLSALDRRKRKPFSYAVGRG